MKASRAVVVVGGSAAIVGAGYVQAPKEPLESQLGGEGSAAGADVFAGPAVQNLKGVYQLEIAVVDGEVVDVVFLQAGTSAAQSVGVNNAALPVLRERILAAQDWDVDHVSGASFTSPAMIESAQGAFEAAGLD